MKKSRSISLLLLVVMFLPIASCRSEDDIRPNIDEERIRAAGRPEFKVGDLVRNILIDRNPSLANIEGVVLKVIISGPDNSGTYTSDGWWYWVKYFYYDGKTRCWHSEWWHEGSCAAVDLRKEWGEE
jgi:hypothetical protein